MRYLGNCFFILLVSFPLIFMSCNKDEAYSPDFKYSYYPLDIGHWVTYQVDSFFFFNAALPQVIKDTISFEIREEITATFTDNEGRLAYRIERSKRKNENESWAIDRVWSVLSTDGTLQKNEDNLRFIKLVFPPKLAEPWDGNALISDQGDPSLAYLQNWSYSITDLDVASTVNGLSFDSTMTIIQADNENLIEKTYAVEQYAKNVGLVYSELQVLFKQNVNVGWDMPELGVIIKHQIIDYKDS